MPQQILYLKTDSTENSQETVVVDFGGSGRYARSFEISFGNQYGGETSYFLANCDNSQRYPHGHLRQFTNLPTDTKKVWMINKEVSRLEVHCNGVEVLVHLFAGAEDAVCSQLYGVDKISEVVFPPRDTATDFYYVGQRSECVSTASLFDQIV